MPVILASQSPTRAGLLRNAGVAFTAMAPGVDERAVERPLVEAGRPPAEIAMALAEAKALALAERHPDACVIGADQTLDLDGSLWTKPADRDAARRQLAALSGRTHRLHSAVAGVRHGTVAWRALESAAMTVRQLSPADIEAYLDRAGTAALSSVGAYQVEGPGIQLFDRIEGDYFTILGLPLLPLLGWLRSEGAL